MKSNIISNEWIYFIAEDPYSDKIKIGKTRRDIEKRLAELQTGNGNKLVLIEKILCNKSDNFEAYLHKIYTSKHILGEWYRFNKEELSLLITEVKVINAKLCYLPNILRYKWQEYLVKELYCNPKIPQNHSVLPIDEGLLVVTENGLQKVLWENTDEVLNTMAIYADNYGRIALSKIKKDKKLRLIAPDEILKSMEEYLDISANRPKDEYDKRCVLNTLKENSEVIKLTIEAMIDK